VDHRSPPRLTTRAPDAPAGLADILETGLEPDEGKRFASMSELLARLLDFARSLDPELALRHAPSIPQGPRSDPGPREMPPRRGRTGTLHDAPTRTVTASTEPGVEAFEDTTFQVDWESMANRSLDVNRLETALEEADKAIKLHASRGERLGHMRAVQASACRWLGRFSEAEIWARQAMDYLPRGSAGWYMAFGHLTAVCGSLGKNEELGGLLAELDQRASAGDRGVAVVKAMSQLAVVLVRTGDVDEARRLLDRADTMASTISVEGAVPDAWVDVARAELSIHEGDLPAHLCNLERAVMWLNEAGDVRNVCLQQANIGNAYLQLGGYAEAERVLYQVLRLGEPMKLGLIEVARANLSFVLCRLGQLREARSVAMFALQQCTSQRHRRAEAIARVYLTEIHRRSGDLAAAEAEATRAVEAAAGTPAARAHALAMLADIRLEQGRAADAFDPAAEAVDVLDSLGGIEEGESLIRLVSVRVLRENGKLGAAAQRAAEAKRRLVERADRIADPAWRRSFLENIPENAATAQLAEATTLTPS
jgi:eukaryotic-like serine/threonine-protein kinase